MISSASSSGSPYSVALPSRFMRADEDSIASTTRALTFSRARSSSSSVAGCSRSRSSSAPTTSIACARLSGRVPA